MSGIPGKENVGRGRGRGRARALQQVAVASSTSSKPLTTSTGSTSTPTIQGGRTASTHSGSTDSSDATRLSRDLQELQVGSKADANLVPIALRPDEGSDLGAPLALRANLFPIQFTPGELMVHQYYIDITHEYRKLNRSEVYEVFWAAVIQFKARFNNQYGIVFDGGHMVFANRKINLDKGDKAQFPIEVILARDDRPSRCTIDLKYLNQHRMELRKNVKNPAENQLTIQIMDIVLRASKTCPFVRSPFVAGARSYYRQNDQREQGNDLGLGREIWSGYYSSVHQARSWKAIVNVDTSHTAFFKEQPVINFVCEILSAKASRDPRQRSPWNVNSLDRRATMTPMECKVVEKELKGLTVFTNHRQQDASEHRRGYKIRSVTTKSSLQLKFTMRDQSGLEREISVESYFKKIGYNMKYPDMACLQVGSAKRPTYLPLEVCQIAPGQKSMKKLTEDQTSRMIRKACTDAPTRERLIADMMTESQLSKDQFAKEFGLHVESRMMEVEGRRMVNPKVLVARNKAIEVRNGVWDLRGNCFHKPGTVGYWGILSFLRRDKQQVLETFSQALSSACLQLGIQMDQWPQSVQYISQVRDILPGCQAVMKEVKERCGDRCGMIIVVLPARMTDYYAEVKRVGEIEIGVTTQCVLQRNVMQAKPMTMGNLALKINAKVGGLNNVINDDPLKTLSTYLLNQDTLVLGIDVSHPGPFDTRSPSIAAIVGNVDKYPGQFGATIRIQKHRRDAVVSLRTAVRERLEQYHNCTRTKPTRIIIYRDGVSEGQFQQVLKAEMSDIREACTSLQEDYQPAITFVVTQKRHHTRFFCRDQKDQNGKAKNIPPGTVVDRAVTHPSQFDFYLCSHYGIQGTSRPTHYTVLHDDNSFSSNAIQTLTYHLCHVYYRCNRAVSIPAPVYYAHLVAQRAKCYLNKFFGDFSDSGSVTTADDDDAASVCTVDSDEVAKACRLRPEMINAMFFA